MTFWDDLSDRIADDDEFARLFAEARVIVVSAEGYDQMMKRLDEPPRVLPGLRRLLEQSREG
jgi:uncharacterized protein (DUF1778 family)